MSERSLLRTAAAAAMLALAAAASAQPTNDTCNGAMVVSCGDIVTGTTLGATADSVNFCGTGDGTGGGVWYRLAGDGDEVTLTTCHAATSYDTKIRVWSGSCGNFTCVAGNDDSACSLRVLTSSVTFQTVVGVDYYILVHGFSGLSGNFGLTVSCAAPPPPLANDNCPDAISMASGASYTGDDRGCTIDGTASCGASAPDAWYTFTADATASAQFSLCDSAFDTVLSVYDACPSAGGTELACNDDACGTRSRLLLPMTAGQTVWVRVSGDGTSGQFSLRADLFAPGINDDCAGALPLLEGQVVTGDTRGNTPGASLPSCASALAPDVWYSFQAAQDSTARFSMCASDFDTVLSVFDGGCPDAGGTEVACNDNLCGSQSEVITNLLAGHTYYLRVTGDGDEGPYALQATTYEPGDFGPDVIYADCNNITNWGSVGDISAYSLASLTCNIGTDNMLWNAGTNTPWLAMNAYRLDDGRLEQIGLSFCKGACCAAASTACGTCNGMGGQLLGVGCSDSYGSGYNGGHSLLGPRSGINAFTGALNYDDSTSGDAIYKRLQVHHDDMDSALHPGALYFVEGVYVGIDEAPTGHGLNNASYKQVNVTQNSWDMNPVGAVSRERAAIYAWRDYGLGAGNPDTSVDIVTTDVPGEGRFYIGAKVTDNGNGSWRYEYAVYNLNSDRSGGAFSVPLPAGVTLTNIGFHDVDYHSGEPYDNADWRATEAAGRITWNSPETFAQNPNSNALRWATMYNFWFDADQPPADGQVQLGLFKPGTPGTVDATLPVPTSPCLCELDGAAGVDVFDLLAYLDLWFDHAAAAELDGAPGVDVFDLLTYLDCWFNASPGSGCS